MSPREQVLVDLLHDLAQPLSAIENGIFCLEFYVDPKNARAQEVLRAVQQQVERASALLSAASAEFHQARAVAAEPEPYRMAAAAR